MMSIRFILLGLVVSAWSLTATAQPSMREAFKQAPQALLPYLTENDRLDLIDFLDSGMKAETKNQLGGKSELLRLTDRFLSLRLSQGLSMKLRLLDSPQPIDSVSQVICMVRTYGIDCQESTVQFYSLKWRQLPTADYLDALPQETFVADLDEQESLLTVQPGCDIEAKAVEEKQKEGKWVVKYKWSSKFVKID
jgi:hypothetical protein